ncbi:MAG: hypothetical protein R3D63_13440 [Paracoccaceae bacterium]
MTAPRPTYQGPNQPILPVRDWRAKALTTVMAMVEAQRLADGDCDIRRETVAEVRLFTLRFEREEVYAAA